MPGRREHLERPEAIAVAEQRRDRPASSGERDRGEAQSDLGDRLGVVGVVVGQQHRAEAAALVDLLADRVEVLPAEPGPGSISQAGSRP